MGVLWCAGGAYGAVLPGWVVDYWGRVLCPLTTGFWAVKVDALSPVEGTGRCLGCLWGLVGRGGVLQGSCGRMLKSAAALQRTGYYLPAASCLLPAACCLTYDFC
jgi:hypothetical protein